MKGKAKQAAGDFTDDEICRRKAKRRSSAARCRGLGKAKREVGNAIKDVGDAIKK